VTSYELVYIVNPEVTEEDLPNILDKVSDSITKIGGNVAEVTQWGRKKLTYPIRKYLEGNYVLTRLELDSTSAKELETNLRLSNEILRHLLVKVKDLA
jgi:small subunit ribosomal protein S6